MGEKQIMFNWWKNVLKKHVEKKENCKKKTWKIGWITSFFAKNHRTINKLNEKVSQKEWKWFESALCN